MKTKKVLVMAVVLQILFVAGIAFAPNQIVWWVCNAVMVYSLLCLALLLSNVMCELFDERGYIEGWEVVRAFWLLPNAALAVAAMNQVS